MQADTPKAGLYVHIPFCKKLCYYCDFHFTVSLRWKDRMVQALLREIEMRAAEAQHWEIGSVYFGGGTPSVLDIADVQLIMQIIVKNYTLKPNPEISFEANPEDLTKDYLDQLQSDTAVNRLSIGTQSFIDTHLKLMNRRHTAKEAYASIQRAQEFGFHNLNVDLIYAIPGMSESEWKSNLEIFNSLQVPHLSAYHLTFESKTVFGHYQQKGKLTPVTDAISLRHFQILMDYTKQAEYEHYEISNFARDGAYSKHNLGYWTGMHYLGFGSSAHSYTGEVRSWNYAINTRYMEMLEDGMLPVAECEVITKEMAFNEYLLTALRTQWGVDLEVLQQKYPQYLEYFKKELQKFVDGGKLIREQSAYCLTDAGKLVADYIISELMLVGE